MKKIISILVALLTATQLYAQQDRSVADILRKLTQNIEIIESKNEEVVRMEADIIATEKTSFRNLQQGWNYGIYVVGSDRIAELDVEVFKQMGNEWASIIKDNNTGPTANVFVKPVSASQYKIVVTVKKFKTGYEVGHYGLLLYHE